MNECLEAARGLVRKAEHDWKNASASLEHDVPLDTVCFHIQQVAEKLLKALMVAEGIEYPFTHDLRDLLDRLVPRFPVLAQFYDTIPDYTDFAVALRYDDSFDPTRDETLEAFECVRRLRALVLELLPPAAQS